MTLMEVDQRGTVRVKELELYQLVELAKDWTYIDLSPGSYSPGVSKYIAKTSERIEFKELLAGRSCVDFSMLQNPSIFVHQKYRMEARCQSRINVALGTVADHPAGVRLELMSGNHGVISGRILFGDNLDRRKERCETGPG
jgi:hypothetical protein